MDFDEIMRADRQRKQDEVRQAELAAEAKKEAEAAAALRMKKHLAVVGPLLKAMRARWEAKFKNFPEYRCVGQTSPPVGPRKGVNWVRVSVSPSKGGSASKHFDIHAAADLESGTIKVLGYSERYPTVEIASGLEPGKISVEKMDELLATFADWFTHLNRKE